MSDLTSIMIMERGAPRQHRVLWHYIHESKPAVCRDQPRNTNSAATADDLDWWDDQLSIFIWFHVRSLRICCFVCPENAKPILLQKGTLGRSSRNKHAGQNLLQVLLHGHSTLMQFVASVTKVSIWRHSHPCHSVVQSKQCAFPSLAVLLINNMQIFKVWLGGGTVEFLVS
jgi:hypothetical protein